MTLVQCARCGDPTTVDDLYEHEMDFPDGTMVWIKSKDGVCGSCRKEIEDFRKCDATVKWEV